MTGTLKEEDIEKEDYIKTWGKDSHPQTEERGLRINQPHQYLADSLDFWPPEL